jgi:hypothetical protein
VFEDGYSSFNIAVAIWIRAAVRTLRVGIIRKHPPGQTRDHFMARLGALIEQSAHRNATAVDQAEITQDLIQQISIKRRLCTNQFEMSFRWPDRLGRDEMLRFDPRTCLAAPDIAPETAPCRCLLP